MGYKYMSSDLKKTLTCKQTGYCADVVQLMGTLGRIHIIGCRQGGKIPLWMRDIQKLSHSRSSRRLSPTSIMHMHISPLGCFGSKDLFMNKRVIKKKKKIEHQIILVIDLVVS